MNEAIGGIQTPVRLDYTVDAGLAPSRFLNGIAQGHILGQRCPQCKKVYVPPHGCCPVCAVLTEEEVEVSETGTITTFCIVNLPFAGRKIEIPYVCASVLLDGADTTLFHLVQEVPAGEVRMGMRVKAVWVSAEELGPSLQSIKYFKPTGEPDAPIEP